MHFPPFLQVVWYSSFQSFQNPIIFRKLGFLEWYHYEFFTENKISIFPLFLPNHFFLVGYFSSFYIQIPLFDYFFLLFLLFGRLPCKDVYPYSTMNKYTQKSSWVQKLVHDERPSILQQIFRWNKILKNRFLLCISALLLTNITPPSPVHIAATR